ncbi:integral membrane protein,Mpv17/PMP22 [Trichoderma guizhouense]|uniref:Integral membrane protein,Mpv17/PMP22 n=1 Tax=Trichoderma guizhouense TaxID=1491466 RepID=A0A1T3CKK0_9HYPO|nr:integral membrane protein,Mpv17/PMP22 [Trichoderma guizhouense]
MAPSPIIQATLQSSLLAALSNILAQAITAYRNNEAVTIDWVPVFQYVLFAVVSTPPNFLWQDFLESTFPAHPSPKSPSNSKGKSPSSSPSQPPPLSLTNTILKFLLDQTIGAALNTLLFSTFTHSLRQAMVHAPRITNLPSAAKYWSSAGAVDFNRVDFGRVWAASKAEFWGLMFAAAKLWPAVSLVNFTLVKSVQGRNLVGALAGVAWGVYISLAMGN